jgi:hypothetical protein
LIPYLRAFWRNLTRRRTLDKDLDDEIRSYVEMSAEENVGSGMPADRAYRDARLAIGGVEQVKQAVRDRSTGVFLDTLMQDLRYALHTQEKFRVFFRRGPYPGTGHRRKHRYLHGRKQRTCQAAALP